MAEITAGGPAFGSSEAEARVKRRRRAEWRLKFYGLLAITLAGLALVALLWSVVGKAAGALTETYVTIPVEISAEELGLGADATPRDILRADFGGLTKDALRAHFPDAKGRSTRKLLNDVVSNGASFELAEKVSAEPALIGQTIDYRFLASDVSDLYLKGAYGALEPVATRGQLTIAVEDGEAQITDSAEDFGEVLLAVKAGLGDEAARLRHQAELQARGAEEFRRRAEAAESAEDKAAAAAEAANREAERDRLLGLAEGLEARAAGAEGTEDLDEGHRSLLIRAGGGWIKLTSLDVATATGEVLAGLSGPLEGISDWTLYRTELPEEARKVADEQIVWLEILKSQDRVETVFNSRFFSAGDSREPELAGIWGAAVGSFWTMLVTFCLAFPIGVLAAVYLEEFAPKNRLTDLIEVNINNLAAVPSIIFGLLGLAVVIGFFGVPRSAPLAGGMVMALMTLPTIIIASRASIAAVPPSIREAALGVGASELQTAFHHVLPLAIPGVLTGTIIGMARALGETAPLIMIGMVAFIVDIPDGITDSATVLPVQVFRWSDFPERAFESRTALAICVLLVFLIAMNALAVLLRKRFERRW